MSQASSLPTCVGPYRIVRQLGAGGMGAVFEGLHEAIARRVAIKVLHADYNTDKEIVQRLFTEARATNLIEHPSLVQVSDFGQLADGRPYLVMELLKGESLGERLRRLPRPPLAWVLAVAWQIADALTAAHERGIIHRDLKPDNIMLVPDSVAQGGERIKVLDFGLAKEA